MKKFEFPMKEIEALPAEVKTYILLLIVRHVEDELNANAEKSYAKYDINAKYIAKVLGAVESNTEDDDEDE